MVVPASPPNPEAPPVQNADEAEELAAGMDTPSATREAPGWDGPVIATSTIPMPRATTATNITLTSHPFARLTLSAHYRDYDYINDTPSLFFSNYVYTDRQLDNLARQSLPYGFNQQNIGTSASWLLHKGESITASYEFIDLERQHRDVSKTREHIGSVTFDANPKQWFSFRTSYQRSERNPQSYVLNLELYPLGGHPLV